MMTFTDLASVPSDPLAPFTDQLRLAVAAYPARFKGSSREHTESDLRCYLAGPPEPGPPVTSRSCRLAEAGAGLGGTVILSIPRAPQQPLTAGRTT